MPREYWAVLKTGMLDQWEMHPKKESSREAVQDQYGVLMDIHSLGTKKDEAEEDFRTLRNARLVHIRKLQRAAFHPFKRIVETCDGIEKDYLDTLDEIRRHLDDHNLEYAAKWLRGHVEKEHIYKHTKSIREAILDKKRNLTLDELEDWLTRHSQDFTNQLISGFWEHGSSSLFDAATKQERFLAYGKLADRYYRRWLEDIRQYREDLNYLVKEGIDAEELERLVELREQEAAV